MTVNSRGFTLIELLSVVAIIGLLAAIAIPRLNGHRARAHNASALTDIRTIRLAEHALFAIKQQYGSTGGEPGARAIPSVPVINFGVGGVTDVVLRPGTALGGYRHRGVGHRSRQERPRRSRLLRGL